MIAHETKTHLDKKLNIAALHIKTRSHSGRFIKPAANSVVARSSGDDIWHAVRRNRCKFGCARSNAVTYSSLRLVLRLGGIVSMNLV